MKFLILDKWLLVSRFCLNISFWLFLLTGILYVSYDSSEVENMFLTISIISLPTLGILALLISGTIRVAYRRKIVTVKNGILIYDGANTKIVNFKINVNKKQKEREMGHQIEIDNSTHFLIDKRAVYILEKMENDVEIKCNPNFKQVKTEMINKGSYFLMGNVNFSDFESLVG